MIRLYGGNGTNREFKPRLVKTLLRYEALTVPLAPEEIFTNRFWEQAQAKY